MSAAQRPRRDDRQRVMVTPEGIALPLTLASRGARAGALMLDLTFIVMLMIALTILLAYVAGGTVGALAQAKQTGAVGHAL